MAIFMSYSHEDADFVDQLAGHLVANNASVWVDRWELHVGDSLRERVEAAMEQASAVVFVLSPASVASEWCKRELSAGLVRELEEHRVMMLWLWSRIVRYPCFSVTSCMPIFERTLMLAYAKCWKR
jgi:TIR domain